MVNTDNLHIYLAIRKREDASLLEDKLVLDGFDVSTFPSARALWDAFQQKPARFIITDRRFGDDFSGLDLARQLREHYTLPNVYFVVLSAMNRLKEIKERLAAGVDDYLVKPHNPLQLRSRILVGIAVAELYRLALRGQVGQEVMDLTTILFAWHSNLNYRNVDRRGRAMRQLIQGEHGGRSC